MIDLDKLLELEARATKAKWLWEHNDYYITGPEVDDSDYQGPIICGTNDPNRKQNAELIEVMRNNIKELCTELRAAREVVEASRVGSFHHPACPYYNGAERCGCSNQLVKDALKAYDEARQK